MSTGVFLDGQTRPAFIDEAKGLHGPLNIKFRPMTYEEIERLESQFDADVKKRISLAIGAIARQVTEWDAKSDSKPVPVIGDNVRKLHPRLVNALYAIIVGRSAGDLPPGSAPPGEVDEFTAELLNAAGGETREDTAIKN